MNTIKFKNVYVSYYVRPGSKNAKIKHSSCLQVIKKSVKGEAHKGIIAVQRVKDTDTDVNWVIVEAEHISSMTSL